MSRVSVVIMTKDRRDEVVATIERFTTDAPDVPIIVVDNGSSDATAAAIRRRFPAVRVLEMVDNVGVAARNTAVAHATTPYVAFNDDDSWWEVGSLRRLVDLFDAHPRIGAISARVVVDPGGHPDPTSVTMDRSPLRDGTTLPGIPVLGFLACAVAVRVEAFRSVGGFEEHFHFGGEEQLLATDLAAAGWAVRYVPDLRVHHQPSDSRDGRWRRRRSVRNTLWFLWLRRPWRTAIARSVAVVRAADPAAACAGAVDALRGLPWVVRERRVVPPHLEGQLRLLDHPSAGRDAA